MHKLSFALALVPMVACTTSVPSESEEVTSAIEKENGGLDTIDEAALFGEQDLFDAAAIESDGAVSDPIANDSTLDQMQRSTTAAAHRLIVMWGKMPADRDAETPRDWSGTLSVSRGGLIVRRTIAFEDATDRLLPRATRDAVSFKSITRPFVDGLALVVVDPTPEATDAITLTYTSADGSATYALDLSKLADGPIVVDAGDGNKIVAAGRRHRADNSDPCDAGTMRGRWHAVAPHLGVFRGIVSDEDGTPVGHVRGVYGQRRNGDQVVFGKFINREGQFRGILAGHYTDDGKFEARWLDRAGDHGVIKGHAFEGGNVRAGRFLARWHETSCRQ